MARGLMLYAVALETYASLPDPVDVDALLARYQLEARALPNAMHLPASLDWLLALDDTLEAEGYPEGFRYEALTLADVPARVLGIVDYPLLGFIAPAVVAAAVARPRAWLDVLPADPSSRALEELFEAAGQAAALGCGLAGVYA